ncbi:MAG: hypothetical protein ACI84C_000772 [Flavobacteriales bacterium]|jgi:hypothetical protein
MITRENYEIWMIDYLDGALDAAGLEEMGAFLAANPDIREEIEGLEDLYLQAPEIKMSNKSSLLKTALPCSPGQLDHQLIALLEGDLDPEEEKEARVWISENAEVAEIWALVQKSRLKADQVAFTGKSNLLVAEIIDLSLAEHRMVALMEGDLSPSDGLAVEGEIASSKELDATYGLLNATKVQADQSVVYANKGELYKTAVIPLFSYVRYAIALAAAILLGVFVWNNFSTDIGSRFANHNIKSTVRDIAEQKTPVILAIDEVSENVKSQVASKDQMQVFQPMQREAIVMNGMDTRFASLLEVNDASPVMQGSIQFVDIKSYPEVESEILFANNTMAEKVGGLAGLLVSKTKAMMPQALALAETPAAESAIKLWNQYRDQKMRGSQLDKADDLASNERVLFSMGKLRVSKKH